MNEQFIRIEPFVYHQPIFCTGQRGKCLINHRETAWRFGAGSEKYRCPLDTGFFKETENSEQQRRVITPCEIWPGSAGNAC